MLVYKNCSKIVLKDIKLVLRRRKIYILTENVIARNIQKNITSTDKKIVSCSSVSSISSY